MVLIVYDEERGKSFHGTSSKIILGRDIHLRYVYPKVMTNSSVRREEDKFQSEVCLMMSVEHGELKKRKQTKNANLDRAVHL